jgi:PleD family two-component response regulator
MAQGFGLRRSEIDDKREERAIRDGVLLARWFILYELDREIERSRRHGRPLSVAVLKPEFPPLDDGRNDPAVELAAQSARAVARTTDLIGWLAGGAFIVVMPETTAEQATLAASRWRDEMYQRSEQLSNTRWDLDCVLDPLGFTDGQAILDTIGARVANRRA